MSIIRIPVTQEHIARGKPGKPNDCPVYHAIKEWQWDALPAVGTDHLVIKVRDADGITWAQVREFDQELQDWVATFDGGDAVHPFTLLLDQERMQARRGEAGPDLPSNPAQGATQG